MLRQRRAAFLAVAGQQVQHTRRQVLVAQLRDAQQSERRILGRFQHQRIACRNRHRDLQRAEHHRCVPRHDAPDHADGLAPRVAEDVLAERDRFALELAGDAAEIADDVGRALDLGTGLRPDRVPRFQGEDPREGLDLGLHGVGDPQQHPSAVARCHEPPRLERGGSGADRRVDIGAGRARHLADRGAVRRVFDVDEPAVRAFGRFSLNQHQVAGHRLFVAEAHGGGSH